MTSSQPLGYLAKPATGTGLGVLLLHAWWGLNDTIKAICEKLASAGFVAFAPDLYEGKVTDSIAGAEALATALDDDKAKATLVEATTFLAETAVSSDNLAVIGFSLGASYALHLAATQPCFKTAVIFYGTGDSDLTHSQAQFLGHFAAEDEYEPQEFVDYVENSLKTAGRPYTFHTYPNTGHWFFEPDRTDAYNKTAADLAWERTITFLQHTLQGT